MPELDEPRPRSWRRATLAACGLTAMLVAVALVSLEPESLRAKRVDVPPDVSRCADHPTFVGPRRTALLPSASIALSAASLVSQRITSSYQRMSSSLSCTGISSCRGAGTCCCSS